MSKEQARCLRFECVWHGTELSADAPMCDYAFLHSVHTIPYDEPARLCDPAVRKSKTSDNCPFYKPGDSFTIAEGFHGRGGETLTRFKTVAREKPSPARIAAFVKRMRKGESQSQPRTNKRPDPLKMLEAWSAGMSDEEMARYGNTTVFYVRKWRNEHGIKRSTHPDKIPVDDNLVLKLYDKGIPDYKIAKMLGISKTSARNHRAVAEAERNLRRANERAEDESN